MCVCTSIRAGDDARRPPSVGGSGLCGCGMAKGPGLARQGILPSGAAPVVRPGRGASATRNVQHRPASAVHRAFANPAEGAGSRKVNPADSRAARTGGTKRQAVTHAHDRHGDPVRCSGPAVRAASADSKLGSPSTTMGPVALGGQTGRKGHRVGPTEAQVEVALRRLFGERGGIEGAPRCPS